MLACGDSSNYAQDTSDIYFDKYRFESDPVLLSGIAQHLQPLVPAGREVLAGIEIGGIPIATALSLISGLPGSGAAHESYGIAVVAMMAPMAIMHTI